MSNFLLNLQFFAGEDVGDGGAENQTEKILTDDEIDASTNSLFDEKSELLGGGSYSEDEETPPMEESEGEFPLELASEPETKPFRVLKGPAGEIPIATQEEYDRMAAAGLESAELQRRLTPYAPFIGEIESDPELARSVIELINARKRGGAPVEEPKPEDDAPPEQGDDESYDAYEGRMEAWRKEQQQKLVDRRIQETLSLQEKQKQAAIQMEMQQKVVEYTKADPRYREILDVVTSPAFPKPLRQAMDQDPRTFMMVYDTLCNFQGRPGHFGAPVGGFGAGGAAGGGAPVSNGGAQGRTVIKERKTVPFAERGTATPEQRGGSGLPDYKTMTEAEFEAALERNRTRGF